MEIIEYPAPIEAHFEGGRQWPDVAENGGPFPHLLFSQPAVDVLCHDDPTASVSETAKVTFRPNKSLSRTGPPDYRTFSPSCTLPRKEIDPDANSPAIFRIAEFQQSCAHQHLFCNDYVKAHIEGVKFKNFVFEPLVDYLRKSDEHRAMFPGRKKT